MSVKKIIIDIDNSGRRIDNFLLNLLKDIPKSKIYKIIRRGEVRINSKRCKPSQKIKEKDLIRIPPLTNTKTRNENKTSKGMLELIKDSVLFEDDYFLVLNKMHGISVHGGTKVKLSLIDIIKSVFGECSDLCHRIDKDTSGCIVISKRKIANRYFNKIQVSGNISKEYIAVLHGKITDKLMLDFEISKKNKKHKDAKSLITPIKYFDSFTAAKIKIFTGRTHQIRQQCSIINHPIVNDSKYGNRKIDKKFIEKFNMKRMMLHSYEIAFYDMEDKLIKCIAMPDSSMKSLFKNHI